jgi:hypothetical protein
MSHVVALIWFVYSVIGSNNLIWRDVTCIRPKKGGKWLVAYVTFVQCGPLLPEEDEEPPWANTSCGLMIELTANPIPNVATMLIPYVIARGWSAANLLIFSRNPLNIVIIN